MRRPAPSHLVLAALLLAGASPALAQSAQVPPPPAPTLKERAGHALDAVTLKPQAGADADMTAVLDGVKSLGMKPIEDLSPAEARKQPTVADGAKVVMQRQGRSTAPEPGVTAKDVSIPGPGGPIPARVYAPEGAGGPLPVVVYYHGGGFVIADLDVYDATPRALAKATGAVVVSSHYRQGPEHKFPAAHDDAVAAYRWALANAASFGGDAKRVAVAGESAGGNLALNVSLAARDGGFQAPLAQVLVYPVAGTDTDTPSYRENANAKPLNKPMMLWFVGHYLKGEADKADPRIDVNGRADVKGLPPTTIINAEIDPLLTDGTRLAEKLRAAGVNVEQRTFEGVTHEFFGLGSVVAKAKDAQAYAAERLKAALGPTATGSVRP